MSTWSIQPPRLRDDADRQLERRTSWLELFFDLVFVAVIAQLSERLSTRPDAAGVAEFGLLFVPVWWVWIGNVFYNERFETDDLGQRVITLLQMLPVVAMAAVIPRGLGAFAPFALSYVAARVVLIALYLRAGVHNPVTRAIHVRFVAGFGFSVLCFLVATISPPRTAYALAGAGLLIDLLTPFATFALQGKLPSFDQSRLQERYGLFVVIVLGEAVTAVVRGEARSASLTPASLSTGALALVFVFGLWWVYFDHVHGRFVRPPLARQALWSYAHMPLLMGVVAFAAAVSEAPAGWHAELHAPLRWLVAGSVSVVFVCFGLLEWTLAPRGPADRSPVQRALVRFACAAAVLVTGPGWLPGGLPGRLVVLLGCLAGQVYDGIWLRVRVVRAGASPSAAKDAPPSR